jgi:DNA-binding GntR family transcriptional regulator
LQEIDDLYDYREAIEPHAARRAAQFITSAQLNRLRHMCSDQQSMIERINASGKAASGALLNDWLNADAQFHLQIIEASRNRYMMRAVSESRLLSRVFMLHRDLAGLVTANSSATTYAAHVELVDALARGDQDAAAAMVLEQIQLGRQSVISKASG